MTRKPKTPEELATVASKRKTYALYLEVELMEYLKMRSSKTGLSALVNEAIRGYVEFLKEQDKKSR